jgi:hypothetical protein
MIGSRNAQKRIILDKQNGSTLLSCNLVRRSPHIHPPSPNGPTAEA